MVLTRPLLAATVVLLADPLAAQRAASPCPVVLPGLVAPAAQDCGEFACGVERWAVKTLTDRDRGSVDFTPRPTTLAVLGALPVPRRRPADRRAGPHERRVYCVEAWITSFSTLEDGDLHLQLLDVADGRSRLIAEVPEVRCKVVCASPWANAFATARAQVERALATWTTDSLRVIITGVGFFDRDHGQLGAAPNFFELHPVLAVRFPVRQ